MPRRNRAPRPRTRAAHVAQRLVARGLAPLVILEVSEAYVPTPRAPDGDGDAS